MRITSIASTELFTGERTDPLQVVRVEADQPGPSWIEIVGAGVSGAGELPDGQLTAEVGVRVTAPVGAVLPIEVTVGSGADRATATGQLVVAEPGWTVWMVPHFHYDPVWWTTQAAYTATWGAADQMGGEFRADFQQTGFDLVRLHLETARREPDYKFVLAELDYLKPYWDSQPGDRAYLRGLLAQGRVELMGGTYNEPSTNLTSAESTIRNLVYGAGFQRDILGGDPRTAWQLDAFGHDPQFPGLVAEAGLDSSSWARGPFHQWGPMLWTHAPGPDGWGDPSSMQFRSEFEWLSPSGQGVLTHYMPAHYSAGWRIDAKPTLAEAEAGVYELFLLLKKVAATRNVLLPVGTDYTPPAKWVTEIHRDWNARYAWPRFLCGLPREFFGAVRAQLHRDDRHLSAQTRDMNPVYTGKDVSYIDTKQAQRHVEALLIDAEKFATVAASLGARYPHAEVDKAWRQLVYGAHHDAITGSESDQVYLDLLTGWREAFDLAGTVLDDALHYLATSAAVLPAPEAAVLPAPETTVPGNNGAERRIVVFNPTSWARRGLVRVRVAFDEPGTRGVAVRAGTRDLPVLLEHPHTHPDGTLAAVDVVFLADDVPPVGYRTWRVTGLAQPGPLGWQPVRDRDRPTIENATHRLTVDPARGGCVSSLTDLRTGRTVLQPGRLGNELLVYDEYPAHPRFHEGPWHLLPKGGPVLGSADTPAESILIETCALGERVTVTGRVGPVRYTQELTLWEGIDRIGCTTHVDRFTGVDQLIRLRWPVTVPGALPVSEAADAVIGRGFGLVDVDAAQTPWTLDNPAYRWFALSATARVDLHDPDGVRLHSRAIGVAEIVAPERDTGDPGVRGLAVALVRQGVTATCSTDTGPRYGTLAVDSNLPDVRIAVGGPDSNAYTAQLLADADPRYATELSEQLSATGRARIWVPADEPLTRVWVPHADLTGPRALPVLVVVGADEVAQLCADVADGRIPVRQPASLSPAVDPDLDDYTVGVVNRGVPGFAVDTTGALHLSLLRSCTGWPSGVWIDPPRRTTPDGSTFQQQHWTHSFDYALVTAPGDWRAAGLVAHGHEVNHPLLARVFDALPAGEGAAGSFVSVEPAGTVILAALKPAGNPLARGKLPGERVDRVTVRLYEATGRPAVARIGMWAPVTDAVDANLLEQPRGSAARVTGDTVRVPLDGAAIKQWLVGIAPAPGRDPAPAVPAPTVAAPPAFSRYWLHNTGPAPTGNMPVAVHVEPTHAAVSGPVTVTVTVASDLTEEPVTGRVELLAPDGWRCEPATLPYDLKPGGHLVQPVLVTPPAAAPPGVYWLRTRIEQDGRTVEDVTRLLVGVSGPERVEASRGTRSVRLRPGEAGTIEVDLRSDAATPVSVDAHLIGPWHTWELFPTAYTSVEVPARDTVTLRLPVRVPADHRPGHWWGLLRLAHAGELHYTEPFEIEVLP